MRETSPARKAVDTTDPVRLAELYEAHANPNDTTAISVCWEIAGNKHASNDLLQKIAKSSPYANTRDRAVRTLARKAGVA